MTPRNLTQIGFLPFCLFLSLSLSPTRQLENADGWPDKICIQCVHQVSRCHAFKKRVENSDNELHKYIKGITVIVEEPMGQLELQQPQHQVHQTVQLKADPTIHITGELVNHHQHHHHHQQQHHHHPHHQVQNVTIQQPTGSGPQIVTTTTHQPQQMIITNGQLHNAQIINAAGQIVATPLQSALTTAQMQPTIQLVQTSMC